MITDLPIEWYHKINNLGKNNCLGERYHDMYYIVLESGVTYLPIKTTFKHLSHTFLQILY